MSELFASVDLGGTTFACALADASGRIVAEASAPTDSYEGPEGVLERVARKVSALGQQAGARPLAMGIVVPGLVDLRSGTTKYLPNMPTKWRDVRAAALVEPQVGCPVYLLNDARAAALGEMTFGHGREVDSMVFFTLGTGIGGGLVVDRRLVLGPLGACGEIGHMTIIPDGPPCGCGNRGCLETLFSGPSLTAAGVRLLRSGQAPRLHEMVDGNADRVDPKVMMEAVAAGDVRVEAVLRRAAAYLGIGVANLVTTLDPDLVVLGGGVAQMGALLFDTVRETVRERVFMVPTDRLRIEGSLLGDRAGMLGGIALAMKRGLAEQ